MNILPQSQFQLNHGYSAWKVLGTEMKLISLPTISTREVFPPCLNLHSGLKQDSQNNTGHIYPCSSSSLGAARLTHLHTKRGMSSLNTSACNLDQFLEKAVDYWDDFTL